MTKHTPPEPSNDAAAPAGSASHGLDTAEGLRALLIRLHEAGPGAWRVDREAADLMRYTAIKYRPLARKHGLDPWEIASAAFEAMLAPSTRQADDPWAVVTRAVQITCNVEVRAAGMLVSTGKVRHTSRIAGFHDAIRFAEREHLADYHPAFAVNPATDDEDDTDDNDRARVAAALSETVELFASTGWDAVLVADCVEHLAWFLLNSACLIRVAVDVAVGEDDLQADQARIKASHCRGACERIVSVTVQPTTLGAIAWMGG